MNSYPARSRWIEDLMRDVGEELVQRQNKLSGASATTKGIHYGTQSLVSQADRESEERICEALRNRFPGDAILAEEGTRVEGESGHRWIVDPLDGTINYLHNHPCYAISIGRSAGPSMAEGYVYLPRFHEFYRAHHDGRARRNGTPIAVSGTHTLQRACLTTGAWERDPPASTFNRKTLMKLGTRAEQVHQSGSAALDLCRVARGGVDGFWQLNLAPWDVAAGVVLVEAAGGQITDLRGKNQWWKRGNILATNTHLHDQLLSYMDLPSTG